MIYEIVNPSDAYTIESDRLDLLAMAIILVGNGRYAGKPKDEKDEKIPLFLFDSASEWFEKKFDCEFEKFFDLNKKEIAETLDSVVIGGFSDRETFFSALDKIEDDEKKKQWREEWHDKKRSSLNDIGGYAKRLAGQIRSKI